MTVDLEWMLDLRDAQVAADVQRKAELGWFDVELTMYGCAYWENGKRYYRLSAEAEKIYDFLAYGAQKHLLPTQLTTLSARYPMPAGMQEAVALEVKKALARQMQAQYPIEFLQGLSKLHDAVSEDTGYPYLLRKKAEVEGAFQQEALQRFDALVDDIYACNKLTTEHYTVLKKWYAEELHNFEDEPRYKDLYAKTFYGMAYLDHGTVKYIINARKDSIYKKKYDLLQKAIYTTPLYAQTYYYNHSVKLSQIRQRFETEIQAYLTSTYLEEIQRVVTANEKIDKQTFRSYLAEAEKRYGTPAKETLQQYGYRWGILW